MTDEPPDTKTEPKDHMTDGEEFLTAPPGTRVRVAPTTDSEVREMAYADVDGVIRDLDGNAYGDESYEIVEYLSGGGHE